jgi:hypothetical protein
MPWPDNLDSIPANSAPTPLSDGHVDAHSLLANTAQRVQQSFGVGPVISISNLEQRIAALEQGGGGGGAGYGKFVDEYRLSTDPDDTAAFTKAFDDINNRVLQEPLLLRPGSYYVTADLPVLVCGFTLRGVGSSAVHNRSAIVFAPNLRGLEVQIGGGRNENITVENFALVGQNGLTGTPFWPPRTAGKHGFYVQGNMAHNIFRRVEVFNFDGNGFMFEGGHSYFGGMQHCSVANVAGHGIFNNGQQTGGVWRAEMCDFSWCGCYGICDQVLGWTYDRCHISYGALLVGRLNAVFETFAAGQTVINWWDVLHPEWVGNPNIQLVGAGIAPGTYITALNQSTLAATLNQATTAASADVGPGYTALAFNWVATDAAYTAGSQQVQFGATPVGDWMLGRPVGAANATGDLSVPGGYLPHIQGYDPAINAVWLSRSPGVSGTGLRIGPAGAVFEGLGSGGNRLVDMYSEGDDTSTGCCDIVLNHNAVGTNINQTAWTDQKYRVGVGVYSGAHEMGGGYPWPGWTLNTPHPNEPGLWDGMSSTMYRGTLVNDRGVW